MVIAPFNGIVYCSVDLIFASFVSLREVIKVRAQEVQSNEAQFAGVASAFGIWQPDAFRSRQHLHHRNLRICTARSLGVANPLRQDIHEHRAF